MLGQPSRVRYCSVFFPFSRSFDECRVNVMCYKIVFFGACVSGVEYYGFNGMNLCVHFFRSLSSG
jgi:hypothetical protein